MKQSDSTNSLTALSEVVPILEYFICLDSREPLVDNTLLRTCGCKFIVHQNCWDMWMKNKDDWDCPICRRESLVTGIPQTRDIINVDSTPFNGINYYIGFIIIAVVIIILLLQFSHK